VQELHLTCSGWYTHPSIERLSSRISPELAECVLMSIVHSPVPALSEHPGHVHVMMSEFISPCQPEAISVVLNIPEWFHSFMPFAPTSRLALVMNDFVISMAI
jgi:hypothetical protein